MRLIPIVIGLLFSALSGAASLSCEVLLQTDWSGVYEVNRNLSASEWAALKARPPLLAGDAVHDFMDQASYRDFYYIRLELLNRSAQEQVYQIFPTRPEFKPTPDGKLSVTFHDGGVFHLGSRYQMGFLRWHRNEVFFSFEDVSKGRSLSLSSWSATPVDDEINDDRKLYQLRAERSETSQNKLHFEPLTAANHRPEDGAFDLRFVSRVQQRFVSLVANAEHDSPQAPVRPVIEADAQQILGEANLSKISAGLWSKVLRSRTRFDLESRSFVMGVIFSGPASNEKLEALVGQKAQVLLKYTEETGASAGVFALSYRELIRLSNLKEITFVGQEHIASYLSLYRPKNFPRPPL